MNQATVIPKFVNQPEPPKRKSGSIVFEHEGQQIRVAVPPEQIHAFAPGQAIGITWAPQSFQGRDGNMVNYNKLMSINTPAAPAPANQAASQSPQAPAPAKNSQSMEMAVMGIVGRAMGSGQFAPADIPHLMMEAKVAWQTIMDGKPAENVQIVNAQQLDHGGDDLSDEIPF